MLSFTFNSKITFVFIAFLAFGLALAACSFHGGEEEGGNDKKGYYISFYADGAEAKFDQDVSAKIVRTGDDAFRICLEAMTASPIFAQYIYITATNFSDSAWGGRTYDCILAKEPGAGNDDGNNDWYAHMSLSVRDDGRESGVFTAEFDDVSVSAEKNNDTVTRTLTGGSIRLRITRDDQRGGAGSSESNSGASSASANSGAGSSESNGGASSSESDSGAGSSESDSGASSAKSDSSESSENSKSGAGSSESDSGASSSESSGASSENSKSGADSSESNGGASSAKADSSASSENSKSGASSSGWNNEDIIKYGFSRTAPSSLKVQYDRSERMRIGSFNIQIFGPTKLGRPNVMTILASIATNFDILAIQEVGNNGHPTEATAMRVMNTYVARVNAIVTDAGLEGALGKYAHVRGHQYAYVYRTNAFIINEYELYGDRDDPFTYPPLQAKFTINSTGSSFALKTVHTSPSSRAHNTREIMLIPGALQEMAEMYGVDEVACIGDYNADGSYYIAGSAAQGWLNGFNPKDGWFTVLRNGIDTNVAGGQGYDRIQLSRAFARYYTGRWGVVRFVDYYDITDAEGTPAREGTELALSDHYPIWAEFILW